jgi:hypothetical protein
MAARVRSAALLPLHLPHLRQALCRRRVYHVPKSGGHIGHVSSLATFDRARIDGRIGRVRLRLASSGAEHVTVPGPVPVQLSGVATDDEGAPVSGVTVLVHPWNGPAGLGNAVTTVTDASGKYSVTFNSVLTPGGDLPVPVQTETSGYESYQHDSGPIGCVLRDPSTNACRPGASTFVQNLRIYRIRYVPVGQSTTIDVKLGDPECGDPDALYFCRTVRMTGPPGATVAVQASTNPSTRFAQLALDPASTTCCALAVTAKVPANGELRVYPEVFSSSATYSFTLTSAMLP